MSTRNWICRNKEYLYPPDFKPLNVDCFLICLCSHAGISYIAPHLNNLYFLTLCQRYGVYQVIRWLFMLKLGLSVAMLLAGADHIYLLCIFIARYGHSHISAHSPGGSDVWPLELCVLPVFRPRFVIFLEPNTQTRWSMRQGRDFKGNPADVSGRFKLLLQRVLASVIHHCFNSSPNSPIVL